MRPAPQHRYTDGMTARGFGARLREWRIARRMSQQRLAAAAEVSTRHLSYLETGKSAPSRTMVLVLASALDLPLRDRNALLQAAGFAAVYRESPQSTFDAASPLGRTLDMILRYHGPIPAVAVTPRWDVVQMNAAALRVFAQFMPPDVEPVVAANVMHALCHPRGLRPSIVNWAEVAASALHRVHHESTAEIDRSANEALLESLESYPGVASLRMHQPPHAPDVCLPVHLKGASTELRLFTTITTLGTPLDVSAEEIRIEVYYPADTATESWLHARTDRDAVPLPLGDSMP